MSVQSESGRIDYERSDTAPYPRGSTARETMTDRIDDRQHEREFYDKYPKLNKTKVPTGTGKGDWSGEE